MDMVLVDWTRMGKLYCLAGAVADGKGWKFVRPLLARHKNASVRNVGWSPFLLTNHSRWEIFKLEGTRLAAPEPPHLEDTWVVGMYSRRKFAPQTQRRAILEAGMCAEGEPLFGIHLTGTKTAAYLPPGTGTRSLATLLIDASKITFRVIRCGRNQPPDIRVTLDLPGLSNRSLPVKDHWLLSRAEEAGPDLDRHLQILETSIGQMGQTVAVRLGLSRSFDPDDKEACDKGHCWLMADGFFSFDDPQP